MRMQTWQRQDAVGAVGGRPRSVGVSALLGLVIGLGLTPSGWATTYTFSSIDFNASGTTVATDINDNGQTVGSYGATGATHGFLRSGAAFGQIDVSGVPGSATNTRANGINNNGWIVGSYDANGTTHGFLDIRGGFIPIDVPNATDARAFGINGSGQIVGSYNNNNNAFLYSGGTFSRIDPPAGTFAAQATGINDNGQIVGSYHDGFGDHGFLATPVLAPVPVPASGVLLSLGLAALGSMAIWNRRRGKTDALAG